MFAVPTACTPKSVLLVLKRIPAPRTLAQKKAQKENPGKDLPPNYHIPSFKNAKHWVTHTPKGVPLARPFLITSPEFQQWMEKAVLSLESQLLSLCQTASGGTPPEPSKLFAMLSLLPEDDSVNDLPAGAWTVVRVPPGEEGAQILLERIN
jgi:hypothetical protein